MNIEVYSDGSATTKDKPGGYGWVLVLDGIKHSEGNGHMAGASNNDAEMEAALQGLGAALKFVNTSRAANAETSQVDFNVTLCADSQLILGWASGAYRFKQQDKLAKYQQLQYIVKRLNVKTRWVQGHAGDEHNERCDKLANQARLGVTKKKEKAEAIVNGNTLIGTKKTGTLCVWYKNCLKVIDLDTNVIEDYDRTTHGPRGGLLEIREEKSR
jgi:ribonuclease HI